MSITPTFVVGELSIAEALTEILPHGIAVGGRIVNVKRGNGQTFPMLYRTSNGADRQLSMVRAVLPAARRVERGER